MLKANIKDVISIVDTKSSKQQQTEFYRQKYLIQLLLNMLGIKDVNTSLR